MIHPKGVELYKKTDIIAAVPGKETVDNNNAPPVQKRRIQRTVAFAKPVKANPSLKKFISMDERRLRKPVGRVKDIVEIFEDRSVCLFHFSQGGGKREDEADKKRVFRLIER